MMPNDNYNKNKAVAEQMSGSFIITKLSAFFIQQSLSLFDLRVTDLLLYHLPFYIYILYILSCNIYNRHIRKLLTNN